MRARHFLAVVLVLVLTAIPVLAGAGPGWLPFSRSSGGGGLSAGAADAAYLRLDATNDPVTGNLAVGNGTGTTQIELEGSLTAWTENGDAAYSTVEAASWTGALYDSIVGMAAYSTPYPGNGYCYSTATTPRAAEIWVGSQSSAADSRICGDTSSPIAIGTAAGGNGNLWTEAARFTSSGTVLNEQGAASQDFRVEGDTNANLIYCDSGSDSCGIGTATNIDGANRLTASVNDSSTAIDSVNAAFASRNESTTNNSFAMIGLQSLTTTGVTWGVGRILGRAVNHTAASINGDLIFQARAGSGANWSEPLAIIGATSRVGVGTLSPAARLDVVGIAGTPALIVNDTGVDSDVRIESDTDANVFFVDASANAIGIGTNGPGAGTLTTAKDVWPSTDGARWLGASGLGWAGVLVDSGSAASPAYAFDDDPDTGAWFPAANEMALATGGATRFRVTNTASTFTGDALPEADITRSLGSTSLNWGNAFIKEISHGASGGDPVTIADFLNLPTSTSTFYTIKLPRSIGTTLPTKPTCATPSDGGQLWYGDDTDDVKPAEICVCRGNSDDATAQWIDLFDASNCTL